MRVRFIRAKQGFGYFQGDVANLSDEQAKRLIYEGYAAETEEEEPSDLPEDLPARALLISCGLTTREKILAISDTLSDMDGISKAMAKKIISKLKVQ